MSSFKIELFAELEPALAQETSLNWQKNLQQLSTLLPALIENRGFEQYKNANLCCNLVLVTDEEISALNRQFRQKEGPTDVITFSYADEEGFLPDENNPLAEIYISRDTAIQQAGEHQVSLDEELTLLAVHGLLHALGFDHELSAEEHLLMRQKETELLSALGLGHVAPLTNS